MSTVRRPFVLDKYKNRVLFESGTFTGTGIVDAINAGYEVIESYEVYTEAFDVAKASFIANKNVHIYNKSSSQMYEELVKYNEPITFWLDAHYSGRGTGYMYKTKCPVLLELQEIAKHDIKNHTILIDDMRLFGTDEFEGITIDDLQNAILKINSKYIFAFENGVQENDVLCATVPN